MGDAAPSSRRVRRRSMEGMEEIDPADSSILRSSTASTPLPQHSASLSQVHVSTDRGSDILCLPEPAEGPKFTSSPLPPHQSPANQIGSMASVASSGVQSVSFTTRTGKTLVYQENVVTVNPDGSVTNGNGINTSARWRDQEKLVKEKHLKIYFILCIIAIILFFPTGIPAFMFYWKGKKAYYDGIQSGQGLDLANKHFRYCRNFLLVTLVMFVIVVVLAVSLAEKKRLGY